MAVSDAWASGLLALGAATLSESGGKPLHRRIGPIWPGARLAAPVYTVVCAAYDNLAVHAAITHAPAGWVLGVSVGDGRDGAYWGEILTVAGLAARLSGLVIDGSVRDSSAIAARGFPVFATGLALRGPSKSGPGSAGGFAAIGDVVVQTGDWLIGDADGVVAVASGEVDAVLAAAERRAIREQDLIKGLHSGRTTVELLELDVSAVAVTLPGAVTLPRSAVTSGQLVPGRRGARSRRGPGRF